MPRPARRPGGMPAEATSFVGRRHETAEARRKLTTAHVVSLVGPGGVGKTRLAVRIATGFADGARMAQLPHIPDMREQARRASPGPDAPRTQRLASARARRRGLIRRFS